MNQDTEINASQREAAIRKRVHRLAEFYRHLLTYLTFNLFFCTVAAVLVMMEIRFGKFMYFIAMMSVFGWGIGLLTHAVTVLPIWTIFSSEWEERKVKALMEQQQR